MSRRPVPDDAVLLLRHGQSEWNAEQRWQGHADSPLTELGRRQAQAAGVALVTSGPAVDAVWSSDLGRAIETAELVADSLGIEVIQQDPRFREIGAGPWEGLIRTEIDHGWPGFLDSGQRPDGFEPVASVVERVAAAIADVLASTAGRSVVVTHSGVIRSLRLRVGGPERRIPNLGGCWGWIDPVDGWTLGDPVTLVDETLVTPGAFDPSATGRG